MEESRLGENARVEMAAAIALLHIAGMPVQCNGCGDCCRVFHSRVAVPVAELRRMNPQQRDWMLAQRRVDRTALAARGIRPWESDSVDASLRTCSYFDDEASRCGNYEYRPFACTGFPLYGHAKPDRVTMEQYPRCTFRLMLGLEVEALA